MNSKIRRAGLLAGVFVLLDLFPVITLSQPNLTIGQNFLASSFEANSQAVPPDANGAIGPQYFVEFINGEFACFDRTDPNNVFRESDAIFWSDANVSLSSSQAVTDPRVVYDPFTQRWFASMIDFDANAVDPTTEANDFLLAYSDTSDPTGSWTGMKIRADTSVKHAFADFPTLGVDSNAVYLSGNMYKGSTNNLGPNLLSIPKADLLLSTTNPPTSTYFGILNPTNYGWVLQPATCFDASTNGTVLSVGNINDSAVHSNIFTFKILGSAHSGATLSTPVNITVDPYICPTNTDVMSPLFTPAQPDDTGSLAPLAANDPRFSAKVYRVADVLYGAHNTLFNGLVAIQWYRVSATNGALLEKGMITDPDLDLYFPSIAANAGGTVVIGCNGSSFNTEISSFAYIGQTKNGVTTFSSPVLLVAGVTNYQGAEVVINGSPVSRWGDYSATSLDPSNPTDFWTIQIYPSGVDDTISSITGDPADNIGIWSTQVTELIVSQPLPQLAIAPSGTNVNLSWPTSATGFQLQSVTNLLSTNWVNITSGLSTNSGTISVLVARTNSQKFFRLKQ